MTEGIIETYLFFLKIPPFFKYYLLNIAFLSNNILTLIIKKQTAGLQAFSLLFGSHQEFFPLCFEHFDLSDFHTIQKKYNILFF